MRAGCGICENGCEKKAGQSGQGVCISCKQSMAESALAKIAEFRRLRYPINVLRKTCAYLGATTGEGAWITIRDALRDQ